MDRIKGLVFRADDPERNTSAEFLIAWEGRWFGGRKSPKVTGMKASRMILTMTALHGAEKRMFGTGYMTQEN